MNCGEDGVPGFDEIVTAGVGEDAEGCFGGVGGEDVADELVAVDCGWVITRWFTGEVGEVEDGFEVSVAFDETGSGSLEVGFGELGFEEEVAELEVDLGAVGEFGREFAAALARVF